MTKKDFIERYRMNSGMKGKAEAERTLNNILDLITENVGPEEVAFRGFGSFKTKTYKERRVNNPKAEGCVTIPQREVVKFVAYKPLLKRLEK